MGTMSKLELYSLVLRFRNTLINTDINARPVGLQDFPSGACYDSSMLLGTYLRDQGLLGFLCCSGERGCRSNNSWVSHTWLQKAELIIDITASQFSDCAQEIIVSDSSIWHKSFSVNSQRCSDFRQSSDIADRNLCSIYWEILRCLAM